MALVRGAFVQLLRPGLAMLLTGTRARSEIDDLGQFIEEAERMAILHPDTSKVPIWRRPPTRIEHPISAWRCWGHRPQAPESDEWYLTSVAADCVWEGPVIRAHKRPVDPKYWDAQKKPDAMAERDKTTYAGEMNEYYREMHDTFSLAGIHALKTKEQVIEACYIYSASCYGEVALYGRVAQFELGYRAEVCMIKRLFLMARLRYYFQEMGMSSKFPGMVDSLSRRYGCEVEVV